MKFLLSKWIIILAISVIGGIIGLIYAYSQKPIYTAELSFVLEEEQSGSRLGAYSGLASVVGIDLGSGGGGIFVGDNLMEFMKSRSMIEKTLLTSVNRNGQRQTMADFYIDINSLRKSWEKNPKLKNINFSPNEDRLNFSREKDSLLMVFYKNIVGGNLSVNKKDKKLSIISVVMKSEHELFSKYFTEILVGVVSDFYIETRTKKSVENLAILKNQADSVRRALSSAIRGVAISVDMNPNPNPARQVLRIPSQNRQIDIQANTEILKSLLPNLEMARINLRKETPLIQKIDEPSLPLQKTSASKSKALIIGGILGGFFAVLFLILKRIFRQIMISSS